jgi:hypothetical protein
MLDRFSFSLVMIFSLAIGLLLSNSVLAEDMDELRSAACGEGKAKDSSWHISNLYNCENNSFFVPYHLWTGAKWNWTATTTWNPSSQMVGTARQVRGLASGSHLPLRTRNWHDRRL